MAQRHGRQGLSHDRQPNEPETQLKRSVRLVGCFRAAVPPLTENLVHIAALVAGHKWAVSKGRTPQGQVNLRQGSYQAHEMQLVIYPN